MSAGMADIIAAHQSVWECMGSYEDDRPWLECSCRDSIENDDARWTGDTEAEHAAHVAQELNVATSPTWPPRRGLLRPPRLPRGVGAVTLTVRGKCTVGECFLPIPSLAKFCPMP